MDRASLLWRVFAVNASILVGAAGLIVLTPVSISRGVVLAEVVIVLVGLAAMLSADLLLLRHTLAPLRTLTALMKTVDSLHPGRRLPADAVRGGEVHDLAVAFNSMLDRLEGERQASAGRALAAQEDERARIARELHDQVGQSLTAVTIQAERALAMPGAVDPRLLDGIARASLQSLEDVRRIARDLRPEALDDLGLVNALIVLCRRTADLGEATIERDLSSPIPALGSDVELAVYRIAQEAITNALRHASAQRIVLSLRAQDTLRLEIRDDGVGFPGLASTETVGIAGMHERARLIEGRLMILSESGRGTTVRLEVPL